MSVRVIYDMTNDQYHKHPALGSSGMKVLINETPAHFYEKYLNPDREPEEKSDALDFGGVFDCLVLEPETFEERFIVEKDFPTVKVPLLRDAGREAYDAAKNAYDNMKANKEAFYAEVERSGKQLVKVKDYDIAMKMKNNLVSHPFGFMIEESIKQASIFWIDEETGVECKCRPDMMLTPGMNHAFVYGGILDLKSTRDASPEGFGRQLFDVGYDLSAAHYINGYKRGFDVPMEEAIPWYWPLSEKRPPYLSAFRPISWEQLLRGEHYARQALRIYAECMNTGIWPGYSQDAEPAVTPYYVQRDIDKIMEGKI